MHCCGTWVGVRSVASYIHQTVCLLCHSLADSQAQEADCLKISVGPSIIGEGRDGAVGEPVGDRRVTLHQVERLSKNGGITGRLWKNRGVGIGRRTLVSGAGRTPFFRQATACLNLHAAPVRRWHHRMPVALHPICIPISAPAKPSNAAVSQRGTRRCRWPALLCLVMSAMLSAGEEMPKLIPPPSLAEINAELRKQIGTKLELAQEAYESKRYGEAVDLTDEILSIDPEHDAARQLNYRANKRLIQREGDKRSLTHLLEVQDKANPPDNRDPLRRQPEWRPPLDSESDGLTDIRKKLDQKIDLIDFPNVQIKDFLNTVLWKAYDINLLIDDAVIEGKTVTIKLRDVSVRDVLDFLVLNVQDLAYTVTPSGVWIHEPTKPHLVPKVYSIHYGLVSLGGVNAAGGQQGGGQGGAGGGGGGGTIPGLPANLQGLAQQLGGGQGGAQGQGGQGQQGAQSTLEMVLAWMETWPDQYPTGTTWHLDKMNSKLYVLTTPEFHREIQKMLDQVDQPPPQVFIRARFIEITDGGEFKWGFDLSEFQSPRNASNPNNQRLGVSGKTNIGLPNLATELGGTPLTFALTGLRTDPGFTVTMSALASDSKAKLLTAPAVMTLSGTPAFFTDSTEYNYVSRYTSTSSYTPIVNNNTTVTNTQQLIPEFAQDRVEITLEILPIVGRDMRTVTLELHPVISDFAAGQSISDFQSADILTVPAGSTTSVTQQVPRPTIAHRELRTKSILHDNGYVIIGGLMRHRQFQEDRRVPFLGNIPLIGFLFRSQATVDQSTNLIIVVEAKIITPSGRGLTDDLSAPLSEEEALALEAAKKHRPGQFAPAFFSPDVESNPGAGVAPPAPPARDSLNFTPAPADQPVFESAP